MKLLSAYIVWQVVKQFYLHKIVHFRGWVQMNPPFLVKLYPNTNGQNRDRFKFCVNSKKLKVIMVIMLYSLS